MIDVPDDNDAQIIDIIVTSTMADFGERAESHLDDIIAVPIREGEFKYAQFLSKVAGEVVRRQRM